MKTLVHAWWYLFRNYNTSTGVIGGVTDPNVQDALFLIRDILQPAGK